MKKSVADRRKGYFEGECKMFPALRSNGQSSPAFLFVIIHAASYIKIGFSNIILPFGSVLNFFF